MVYLAPHEDEDGPRPFEYIGPFKSYAEACDWADQHSVLPRMLFGEQFGPLEAEIIVEAWTPDEVLRGVRGPRASDRWRLLLSLVEEGFLR